MSTRKRTQEKAFCLSLALPWDDISEKRRRLQNFSAMPSLMTLFDWESLPDPICLRIFSYFNFCDLILRLSRVCRKFRRLVYDRSLWTDLFLLNAKFEPTENAEPLECQSLIKHLHRLGKFVRKINLRYCGGISNTVLSTLSNDCLVRLQSVSLEGCFHVTDKGLARLATECRSLREVNLLLTSVTSDSVKNICKNNKNLESLICHSSCLTLQTLEVLTYSCPMLQVLHGCDGEMAVMQSNGPHRFSTLTNDMFLQITKLSQIRILILKYDTVNVNDTYFSVLGKSCPYLECLEMSYIVPSAGLSDIGVTQCCNFLRNVQYLHLYEFVSVSNETLKTLAHFCPLLRSVSFENGSFDDDGIITLVQRCTELESLSIGIGDHSSKDITDISATAIAKHCGSKLVRLHMIGWDVSDAGLWSLCQTLTNLKHLSVESCMLLTHEGFFRALRKLQGLLSIDLSFTDIFYDNCNPGDMKFPDSLRRLRVCGLGLTDRELSRFRYLCPGCEVMDF